MGLATFAIGLLPTYAMVGILAPILLVIVRIIQGLAFGAEWGGAILMTYEHAPWRFKGGFTGIVQAGFPVGLLLANLVFLVSVQLPGDWAWRVPFLASIVLVIVGLIIRAKVPESPVFEDVKAEGKILKAPLIEVIKTDWGNILRGIGLRVAETAGYAVSITYLISYLNTNQITESWQTLTALCIAAGVGILATWGWARLTDKIGRRPLYLIVTAMGVFWGFLMFLGVNTAVYPMVVVVIVLSYAVFQNALAGAQGAWFPELFNANTRTSGASLAYQISAMISGFTPFITTLLYGAYGWVGPAALFALYALVGFISALITPETWTALSASSPGRLPRKHGNSSQCADETPAVERAAHPQWCAPLSPRLNPREASDDRQSSDPGLAAQHSAHAGNRRASPSHHHRRASARVPTSPRSRCPHASVSAGAPCGKRCARSSSRASSPRAPAADCSSGAWMKRNFETCSACGPPWRRSLRGPSRRFRHGSKPWWPSGRRRSACRSPRVSLSTPACGPTSTSIANSVA